MTTGEFGCSGFLGCSMQKASAVIVFAFSRSTEEEPSSVGKMSVPMHNNLSQGYALSESRTLDL